MGSHIQSSLKMLTCGEPSPVSRSTGSNLTDEHRVHGFHLPAFNLIGMVINAIYTWPWTRLKNENYKGKKLLTLM